MLTKTQLESLLGRSLSGSEDTNLELYLNIAEERLANLFCVHIGDNTEKTRIYYGREGYTTLYVDPFTALTSVTIDGEAQTTTSYQWDDRNADWFNVLEFSQALEDEEIEVTATFGYGATLPFDLQLLLARMFALTAKENTTDLRVDSKQNEDYRVSYGSGDAKTVLDALIAENRTTIQKYSQCGIGTIDHGDPTKPLHRTRKYSTWLTEE